MNEHVQDLAELVYGELEAARSGLSRTELHACFHRKQSPSDDEVSRSMVIFYKLLIYGKCRCSPLATSAYSLPYSARQCNIRHKHKQGSENAQ